MSIAHGRFAVPAFSASSHRCPFRLRHGRFLTAVAKQTAKATLCPPEDGAQISSPSSTSFSFPARHSLSSNQKDQISLYVRTLLQWNQVYPTVTLRPEEVMQENSSLRSDFHSPRLHFYVAEDESNRGYRGARGDVEARRRFARHPAAAVAVLSITYSKYAGINIFVVGQNVGQSIDYRELFDVAVARAVAEMRTLGRL
ncbi:hypothetical protein BHM03_00023044 [Ensete ventricosum]|nr:hypothetical protein BHM03_00023044 [Ensete ventricosum]